MASTAAVPRDINPVFNSTLVLAGLPGGHRLELRLKDIGMMIQEHFGGRLGPMIIATCSLATGEDIAGYVDLVPVREVAGNGVPVLQLTARFREVGGLLGNTAALVRFRTNPGTGGRSHAHRVEFRRSGAFARASPHFHGPS